MEDFPHKEQTHKIPGACFEVYKEKGCGFLEAVYQECLVFAFVSAFFCVFCGQIIPWGHWEYIATSFVAML
jgi:hypothetical protein